MPTGIFNPFEAPKPKKKDYRSPLKADAHEDPLGEQFPKAPKKIILDGETYGIEFKGTETLDDVRKVLWEMLYEVNKTEKDLLERNGIFVKGKSDEIALSLGELVLALPQGKIIVYAGENGTEIDIYRRLGYALNQVNAKILTRHGVRVIMRG
jgi:hypothetical protein